MEKINVLKGQGDAYDIILPRFIEKGISVVKQETLLLTQLHNKDYWRSISQQDISLALLDPNHWHYSDDVFNEYARKIASVPFLAVCMFDNPYKHKHVFNFDKMLEERSMVLSDSIRSRQKKTVIISPPIQVVETDIQKRFLDYLVQNRSLFDAYGVHCCMHVTDHSMGFLTGLLHQALTALSKPVWVTRWAIPSREYSLEGRVIQSDTPTNNYVLAARNLKTMYQCIDEISPQTKWFFAGAGADEFDSDKTVSKWTDKHFLGLVTPTGEIKEPILKSFLDIHSSYN